ncbi:hypothetical protein AB685_00460 [Bacillus sp. LL01]|uniref:hypothetical protein n=1 Tax=Bacillus sp. LL01 TaxID=1665556 RepID=UPI00064D6A4F|nr:hypothetical protein [Bacillus sp. LL01]KMJ59398.1 hypothetical protein AB685_00460 [Bacillus sp. LL01]
MAQSVKMYKIERYPETFPISSAEVNTGEGTSTFVTTVNILGKGEYTDVDLDKVQIKHQLGDKFDGKGMLEDGSIYDIVAISTEEKFPCFVKDKEFIYTSGTRRIISEQALRRLRSHPDMDVSKRLEAKSVKIDLVKFKEHLQTSREGAIKGGWFRGMKIENVEVAYLGGGSVTESEDWEKYETSGGSISALRIDIPGLTEDSEAIKTLLTRDGNLVIYRHFDEYEMLGIAVPIFEAVENFLL